MLDMMFFIKTIIVTVLLALFLQTKVGEMTLEAHAQHYIHSANLMQPVQEMANNAAIMLKRSLKWMSNEVGKQIHHRSKSKSGSASSDTTEAVTSERVESFSFRRSEAFEKKQSAAKPGSESEAD